MIGTSKGQPHDTIMKACGVSQHRVHSHSLAVPRRRTNAVTNMDGDSSRTRGVRSLQHQEAAGTGGSRKDDDMGMSPLREGAWIDAKTAQWSFLDHHAKCAKRPSNLASISMPGAGREAVRGIPNDYGDENRERLLLTVMALAASGYGGMAIQKPHWTR